MEPRRAFINSVLDAIGAAAAAAAAAAASQSDMKGSASPLPAAVATPVRSPVTPTSHVSPTGSGAAPLRVSAVRVADGRAMRVEGRPCLSLIPLSKPSLSTAPNTKAGDVKSTAGPATTKRPNAKERGRDAKDHPPVWPPAELKSAMASVPRYTPLKTVVGEENRRPLTFHSISALYASKGHEIVRR
jgi:hypothetical protein